ncbi:MAG TPA: permease, partial [Spirochaetota bacterium]|nr:permease [Spirochaetota bacterium]
KHLGKSSFGSVIKATLFGIPLPLCSCGVVPVATSLRKSGASKGASVSFLIATPQIGADSFMITYSLLGWIFALFRIAASLITALAAGLSINMAFKTDAATEKINVNLRNNYFTGVYQRLKSIFYYIEFELLGSIAKSLLAGILVAGSIAVLIPDNFFATYLNHNLLSMLLMLVIGIPMYVCASASTPIAASLILKGISPGAALVFLLTGPATNAVTISTIYKLLGRKALVLYLSAIAGGSLLLGYLLNMITAYAGLDHLIAVQKHQLLPPWLKLTGTIILLFMLLLYFSKIYLIKSKKNINEDAATVIKLQIKGMTCMHCAATVEKTIAAVPGTDQVDVDLKKGTASFKNKDKKRIPEIKEAVARAGYEVVS